MRAELANLNHCAVIFLSRAAVNLSLDDSINYIKCHHEHSVYQIMSLTVNRVYEFNTRAYKFTVVAISKQRTNPRVGCCCL